MPPPNARPSIVENDPRWTAVDAYTTAHLHPPSRPYHDALQHALQNSLDKGLQEIHVAASQGKYLSLQCQIIGAKHVLELGTLGGYSAIWMASSSADVRVVSLEIDPHAAEVARENIRFAGLERRVEVLVGDALEVLPRLMAEVEEGRKERFDFSFIDADKVRALEYFDWVVRMSRKGGVVYVDNMVRRGLLVDEEMAEWDEDVQGLRRTVEEVGKDERVEAVVLQTVSEKNYDGFLMALVT